MGNDDLKIDMRQLAKEFLDSYPIFIRGDAVSYLASLEDDIVEFIEGVSAKVTPPLHIITCASYKDLYETLYNYVVFEIRKRINDVYDNFDCEDKQYEERQYFEIQVEQDGY